MTYADRIDRNIQTGQVSSIPIDNNWILANRARTVQLSLSKTSIVANGSDSATLTVQLYTPRLVDDTYQSVASIESIVLDVGGEPVPVDTDSSGSASLPISAVLPGIYAVSSLSHESNTVSVEATA